MRAGQGRRAGRARLSSAQVAALIAHFAAADEANLVDGDAFLRRLAQLRGEEREARARREAQQAQKKREVLRAGQHVDCLPKCLGR